MPAVFRRCLAAVLISSWCAFAQTPLRFKTRRIDTSVFHEPVSELQSPQSSRRGHLLLQFKNRPSAETAAKLSRRGAHVLEDVPENGLLVSLDRRVPVTDLGIQYAAPIDPADKISPLLPSANGFLLAEFYPDVDMNRARALVLNLGLELRENPDLNPHHLLLRAADSAKLTELAKLDEVAYLFPASDALVNGVPVAPCEGALTTNGAVAQSIPSFGDGWDGPGLGSATILYVFSKMTAQLDASAAQAEVERAMAEWAKAAAIHWMAGTDPRGAKP